MLERSQIELAFELLNAELARKNVTASLYLVGGAVMCLALDARTTTKDVDAWFTEPAAVRQAAAVVARDLALPEDWLNDAAKGFIPEGAGFEAWRTLSHVEISVADLPTMLAMKCAAARSEEDANDIRRLADALGLDSVNAVLDVVSRYIPVARLSVRTQLLVEEMFS